LDLPSQILWENARLGKVCATIGTIFIICLILHTPNTKQDVLNVAEVEHALAAVVHEPVVGVVATELTGTPPMAAAADIAEISIRIAGGGSSLPSSPEQAKKVNVMAKIAANERKRLVFIVNSYC